jgi:hypothetical protein
MRRYLLSFCTSLLLVTVIFPPLTKAQKRGTSQTPPSDNDFRVLGEMSGSEVIQKLAEIGDSEDAQAIAFAAVKRIKPTAKIAEVLTVQDAQVDTVVALNKSIKPYLLATRAFGYIPPNNAAATTLVDLTAASNIAPDMSLKGRAIKITLDRLRIYDYPGKGIHNVLFDFSGRHQAEASNGEDLHFNQTYRAPEGEGASISGVPIFVGLKVGNEGISFAAKTVNVSNESDEKLLGFLEGDLFKRGLQLINSINPVVPIVSGFAENIFKQVASRNKNIAVQDIQLGLDFSDAPARPKLREGSYIAVQAPDGFDITTCQYNPTTGDFVQKTGKSPIPLNYIVFSVSKVQ